MSFAEFSCFFMLIYFVYKKIIYNFALNLMEYVLLNIKK